MENVIGDAMLKMFKKNSPLSGLAEKESIFASHFIRVLNC
jgi:hypothetical protein